MSFNRRAYRGGGVAASFSGSFLSVLPGAFQIMVSDQGVTNGATLIRADQSGNGKNYSTVANQPTTAGTLGGRATLLFGTASKLPSTLNLDPSTTPYEYVMITKVTVWASGSRLLGDAADNAVLWGRDATSGNIGYFAGSFGPQSTALAVGSWGLIRGVVTATLGNSTIQCGAGATVTGPDAGSASSTSRTIGGTTGSSMQQETALVAYGPVGFSAGAAFLSAIDSYWGAGLVAHP